jgi:hypothetical protein
MLSVMGDELSEPAKDSTARPGGRKKWSFRCAGARRTAAGCAKNNKKFARSNTDFQEKVPLSS